MSVGRRSQRTSGCRRTMPEAVHGASSKIASYRWPSHQSAGRLASPITSLARRPRRARFCVMRSQRRASMSSAVTSQSAISSRCAVLPPGAAQASRIFSVAVDPSAASRPFSNSGAASCAAASCTEKWPSAKPGSPVTDCAVAKTTPYSPTAVATIFIAASAHRYWATVVFLSLTRKIRGARALFARKIACQSCGWSLRSRSIHHCGWFHTACGLASVFATSAARSRKKRRRQPLIKLAWCRVASLRLAASTAWSTSVYSV